MIPPTCTLLRASSFPLLTTLSVLLLPLLPSSTHSLPDAAYQALTIRKLAFGSCHSRKAFDRLPPSIPPSNQTIWDVISDRHRPDAFLWAGDAVYPPKKLGDATVDVLVEEYNQLRTNQTLGYARTMLPPSPRAPPGGIHGTYDDHDYGGNDRGREMVDRAARRDAYLDFLGVASDHPRRRRRGLYSSVSFGTAPRKVLVVFLDTRWGRERHCIPSVAATVPFGAIISCVTRWVSAGLNLPDAVPACGNRKMLDEEQWTWLEGEIASSDAQVHIVVSSVQILTTNPVVESWGHFPEERARLLRLVNGLPGLVLISGDAHHADILDALAGIEGEDTGATSGLQYQTRHGIVEVTSSGLTHSEDGFLGAPFLRAFSANRFRGIASDGSVSHHGEYFYTGRNYGTMDINWAPMEKEGGKSDVTTIRVKIHDKSGSIVLSTGPIKTRDVAISTAALTDGELSRVRGCADGHLRPLAEKLLLSLLILCFFSIVWRRRRWRWESENVGALKHKKEQ